MDIEDEKKPFDAETEKDEDSQPDPDETLMLDQGGGQIWLVKIPKHLLRRWAAINVEDVHLATLRIYDADPNTQGAKTRIVLFLPPNRDPRNPHAPLPPQQPNRPVFTTHTNYELEGPQPDCYDLEFVNPSVENQLVVAERPKDLSLSVSQSAAAATPNTRARTTILTGRIKHEGNLKPAFTASYRKQMKQRHISANTPKRTTQLIKDEDIPGGKGGVNRMTSGVGVGAGNRFSNLVKSKQKPAKGAFERMARMPRNQLLDQLFDLFSTQPRWSIRPLREKTQQPEVYLKEVLSDIAFLHKSGEYNGLWELHENHKGGNVKGEDIPQRSPGDIKDEDEEDDEDEDEDEDMEEVS